LTDVSGSVDDNCKKVLRSVNAENDKLYQRNKKLVKERDEIKAKLLIGEQINEDLIAREDEIKSA
jgi:hypothetical protein